MKSFIFLIFLFDSLYSQLTTRNDQRFGLSRFNIIRNGLSKKHFQFYHTVGKQHLKEHWFKQKLNHFNELNDEFWNQRYWHDVSNKRHFNSPMFLSLGGENEAKPDMELAGIERYAKIFGAETFLLEHRFYGKSLPENFDKNICFLSSKQALEDIATFIKAMNHKYNPNFDRKWIIFGCSYSGNLAAWMRLKYPHLISGSVASSAPIEAILNFKQYFEVVYKVLGNECTTNIHSMFDQFKKLSSNKNARDEFVKNFPDFKESYLKDDEIVSELLNNAINTIAELVQYNNPDNRTNNIETFCEKLKKQSLIENMKFLWESQSVFNLDESYKAWLYQICTEFGYFETYTANNDNNNNNNNNSFGISYSLKNYVQECQEYFGENINKMHIERSVENTNNNYGGKHFSGTNVVFVNGQYDPWSALSFHKTIYHSSVISVLIQKESHCSDWRGSSENDPILKQAHIKIFNAIQQYLFYFD